MRTLVVVLVIISPMVSGCLGGSAGEFQAEPQEIVATMRVGGAMVELNLTKADTIANANGSPIPAYEVRISEETTASVVHVARDFTIIRESMPCSNRIDGVCEYYLAQWDETGEPAPLGIGLPVRLDEGARPAWVAEARELGTELEIVIQNSTYTGLPDGIYSYDRGQLVPQSITTSSGVFATLESYEVTGPGLPPTESPGDSSARPPFRVERAESPEFFVGETDFLLGLEFRPIDALDWLTEQSEDFEAIRADGCVPLIILLPRAGGASTAGLITRDDTSIRIEGVDHQGERTRFEFVYRNGTLENGFRDLVEEGVANSIDCAAFDRSDPAIVSASSFLDILRRQDLRIAPGSAFSFHFTFTMERGKLYRGTMVPEYAESDGTGTVGYLVYSVLVDAANGRLKSAHIHPDDMSALDSQGWSE